MVRIAPTVITDDAAIDFVKPQHERWVNLVEQGSIVSIPIPNGEEEATRNVINGALRARNVKASVRRGTDNSGWPVFVVRLRSSGT